MTHELISTIADIALALSLIVGLVFGIAQVKAAARDRHERLTLDTLRNFQTREFAELINYINMHKMPADRKEMMALPENEQVLYIQFAQQMESLGILLAEKLVDFDLVDKTLGSFVTSSWEKYKPVVFDMREKSGDPYLAEYFQWMAEQIDRRMKENPRLPFFQSSKTAG